MSGNTNRRILVTGGAGFIGSALVHLLVEKYPEYKIINLDALTYAGNLENLSDIADRVNYSFVKADIRDYETILGLIRDERISAIINLAAESHVDRSINDPQGFASTNVMGTLSLLQAARSVWGPLGWVVDDHPCRFYQISTDEVYGSLSVDYAEADARGCYGREVFTEETPYNPHSPYSASKASADHFVRAFHDTYGMPVLVSNCSNNYGPRQFPEKLIPLCVNNVLNRKPIPVYGSGANVRDWLYVEDHAAAIDLILHQGVPGQTYNIGGSSECRNIDLVKLIIRVADRILGRAEDEDLGLITFVKDRAGHDLRYAIDSGKLQRELGWKPSLRLEEGLERTVRWYLEHRQWLESVTSGDYLAYYEKQYGTK